MFIISKINLIPKYIPIILLYFVNIITEIDEVF